jgi:hypothetical protein
MKRWLALMSFVCGLPLSTAGAQSPAPERTVTANVLVSTSSPRLRIELPTQARYLGADRWVLYDIADCEAHVFVEADAHKVVRRLYWVQFEGYVPGRPDLKYDYASDPVRRIHGIDFHVRTRSGPTDDPVRAGSDTEHVRQLIHAAGYAMPPDMMDVRLVQLLDATERSELMIIYAETAAAAGIARPDLVSSGKASERRPAIEPAIVQRAAKRIAFHELTEK